MFYFYVFGTKEFLMQVSFMFKPGSSSLLASAILKEIESGYYTHQLTKNVTFKESTFLPVGFRPEAGGQEKDGWLLYSSCAGNWLALRPDTGEGRYGGNRTAFVTFQLMVKDTDIEAWSYPANSTWTPKLTPWEWLSAVESQMLLAVKKARLVSQVRQGLLTPKMIRDWELPQAPLAKYKTLFERTGA